jgi:protein phosphatase
MFIKQFLNPKDWQKYDTPKDQFPFKKQHILELIADAQMRLQAQPLKVDVTPPCKVFGSLHGQYIDLMRFFDTWKFPGESQSGGDIQANDYVFLGNYVDRGVYSLETICLLLALKVKYPKQIHLLRGSHEDRRINISAGFGEECRVRLKENIDEPDSVFQ